MAPKGGAAFCFNYGIAVHGAINVPLAPVSHGCVLIPMHIADYFGDLVTNGDRALVWNAGQQLEGALPVLSWALRDALGILEQEEDSLLDVDEEVLDRIFAEFCVGK